ncbi:hypothetical protein [Ammoniphilus resinae]|uniref:Uncharacterized protein n=1 Tax=Ammoniphilus resinae TaxID=861532 RepID=A0ABS4GMH8_9BACL|nr:hypothetical protein [Ammoniphilus resinae]MBP1931478.1 hypothetical protein [Ammoniphilus resinae]
MINSKMSAELKSGEYSVYDRSGGFDFGDKSMVGTHTLCITNYGRVIAHDTGGIFGSEQVIDYSLSINVTFLNHLIQLSSVSYGKLTFDFMMGVEEFINLFSSIPKNKFTFVNTTSSYIQWQGTTYTLADLIFLENEFQFNGQSVPFRRVDSLSFDEHGKMTIKGHFKGDEYATLYIFNPKIDELKKIQDQWKRTPKLYDLVGKDTTLCPVRLQYKAGGKIRSSEITMVFRGDQVFLVDEASHKVLQSFSIKHDEWYFHSNHTMAVVMKNEIPYVLEFETSSAKKRYDDQLVKKDLKFYGTYQIGGRLKGADFPREPIYLLLHHSDLLFLFANTLTLMKISLQELTTVQNENKIFLLHLLDREIGLLLVSPQDPIQQGIQEKVRREKNLSIGYTSDHQPFYLEQDMNRLVFKQAKNKELFSIANQEVKDFSVTGTQGDFSTVRMVYGNQTQDIHLPTALVPLLIHQTYFYTKAPIVGKVSEDQLYLSWTRLANDHLLYYFFGQLFLLQKGIEEIRNQVKNQNDRNADLINYMYYAIQEQKKRLDAVAIYFPASLHRDGQELLGSELQEDSYRGLQRNLMGITSQIKGSLHEIESALSAVSSIIIPKADMQKFIEEKEKRGYDTSIAVTGTGILLGALTGGIGYAFLLPGAFMGLNNYFSSRDAERLERMRIENEYNRLDFYMTKALDVFDHMMQTLVPYHVAEVNRAAFQTFHSLAPIYQKALSNPEIKEGLFKRISQYYTFKQLPVDQSEMMKKENLIDQIEGSLQVGAEFASLINKEVKYVPKSIEIPRIGSI